MSGDSDLERAATELAQYRANDALPGLLDKYATLIEGYRRLKSDYEEERESREKYKQMVRDQERKPFVLVLIDGDGYVFHENLFANGSDSGSHAAQLLLECVKNSLRAKGLDRCQVMVRVYANIVGLSRLLHKAGLVGAEKRSLSPFIASFNRSYGLADIVDAGELKENTDFKLRAMMKLYAENPQCKHIYFAACHEAGYVSDLLPYVGNRGRFTLVKSMGADFHEEFTKLNLGIEEFPGVFRSTPLEGLGLLRSGSSTFSSTRSQPWSTADQTVAKAEGEKAVCRFFSTGRCKYGKLCKNVHIDDGPNSKATWRTTSNDPQATANTSYTESRRKSPPAYYARSEASTDFASDKHTSSMLWIDIADLPSKSDIPEGQVAVNRGGFRLDPLIEPPAYEVLNRLKVHVNRQRVCNKHHLNGFCEAGDSCLYDHSPLEDGFLPALEWLARSMPCSRRGACRRASCNSGHVCQNTECKYRGGKYYCKLMQQVHYEELKAARYVPATDDGQASRAFRSGAAAEDDDGADVWPESGEDEESLI